LPICFANSRVEVSGVTPGTPVVITEAVGELPHGYAYKGKLGHHKVLVSVYDPSALADPEARDGLLRGLSWARELRHGNLLPTLGWVEGHGTTLEAQRYSFQVEDLSPGRHVFRLKQVDFDGQFEYSPEIELSVELPEAFVVSKVYPNPFNPEASLSFGVRQEQAVRIELFNMLGQRVKVLYEGRPSAGTTKTLRIDGSDLNSGVYLLRVQGERFVDTQTITLVK